MRSVPFFSLPDRWCRKEHKVYYTMICFKRKASANHHILPRRRRCTKVHPMSSGIAISTEGLTNMIYMIRGQKVMLAADLAMLYEIETFNLNKAVKRNIERFPPDFMFQLTAEEWGNLRFQNGIPSLKEWGGRRSPPFAFTEQGVAMLSSILRSRRAAQVNIAIMRTFVEMRKMLFSYADLCRRIDAWESRYDEQFRIVFDALRQLMAPSPPPENEQKIGFRLD